MGRRLRKFTGREMQDTGLEIKGKITAKPLVDKIGPKKLQEFRRLMLKDNGTAAEKIIKNQDLVKCAVELLRDKNRAVSEKTIWSLRCAAEKGADISIAMPELINMLDADTGSISYAAALALGSAVTNDKNRELMLASLTKILSNNDEKISKKNCALLALKEAARRGTDLVFLVPRVTEFLNADYESVGSNTAELLCEIAKKENGNSAFMALVDAIKNSKAKEYVAEALRELAENGIDITAAIPGLADALTDRKEVLTGAVWALREASAKGLDIYIAIPRIAALLGDREISIVRGATQALANAAAKEETREIATRELILALRTASRESLEIIAYALKDNTDRNDAIPVKGTVIVLKTLTDSKRFMAEANANSPFYCEMIKYISIIMTTAQQAEKKLAKQGAVA